MEVLVQLVWRQLRDVVQGVHRSEVGRWKHRSIYLANLSGGSSGTWFKAFRSLC